eukprot:3852421-Rhodomonas_salina.1
MSVRAKTKAKKTGKESAKKTDLEHEAEGGVESKGACASLLCSSLSFQQCFPHCANPANPEQCIVSGIKGKDRSKGES